MSAQAIIVTATSANLAATLARLTRDAPHPEIAIADLMSLVDEGILSPGDFVIAHPVGFSQLVLGALITQQLGGAQAAVWVPVADDEQLADALALGAVRLMSHLGNRVLQAMTAIPSPVHITSLQRAGFRYFSDLVFADLDVPPSDSIEVSKRLALVQTAFDDIGFARLIDATYVGSLDMPELNGVRTPEEILASCQVITKFDPPLWYYAEHDGERVGVLQLAPQDESDFELVYMGLVPRARQRGLGRELARCAIRIVATFGGTRLHLSYDVRNGSAARTYDQLGFVGQCRRAVWINFCSQTPLQSRSLPKT